VFAVNTSAWPGIVWPIAQSVLYLANLVLTARSRRVKALIVRTFQRWTINPLIRGAPHPESGWIEAGGAGQRLPRGDLLANSGEVSTDPVDGVVTQG
jgi:hypothetical protein